MQGETARILVYLGEILFAALIVIVAVRSHLKARRRLEDCWRVFAARHGLSLTWEPKQGRMSMTGVFGGVPVTVSLVRLGTRGRAKDPVYEAPFSVFWPEGLEVHSRRCGWPYAHNAPRTNDPEVERTLVFRAPDPRAVPWLLANPAVRQALLAFFVGEGKTLRRLSARGAYIQDRPMMSDPANLEVQLGALAAVVRAIDAAGASYGR